MGWIQDASSTIRGNPKPLNTQNPLDRTGAWWDKTTGKRGEKQNQEELEAASGKATKEQYGFSDQMQTAEQANLDRMKGYSTSYQNSIRGVMGEEDAKNAMTLQQAQDPNNKVAQDFRNMYNTEAQNQGQQGLADVGVMQSLGAQAFSGKLGGGVPMTGGQLQALMAQNQNQAGQAFANVQRQKQSLRDQGLAQGIMQTQAAWERGQQSKDRYTSGVKDIYNNQSGLSGMESDVSTGNTQRRAAIAGGATAADMARISAQIQNNAMGRQQVMGGIVSAVGPWSGAQGIGTGMAQTGSQAQYGQQQPAGQGTAGGAQAFGGLMSMMGNKNQPTAQQQPQQQPQQYNQYQGWNNQYGGR